MRLICIWLMQFIALTSVAAAEPESTPEQIAAMEKIADLALVPPTLNTAPLPDYDYDKLDYGMTISIERTPNGRLWACWVAGGDSPKAFFVLATSDDDGETWSKPRLVIDAHDKSLPAARSILVGNLWSDPLGRLWLIFDQSMDMFDGRAGVWAAVCDDPDALDPIWSKPHRIWHGVTLNKPTVLTNGEWMLPISLDQRPGFGQFKDCFQALDPLRGANVFVSSDEGDTWQRRGCVKFPNPDWHEHMIIQRRDGSLWMLARTAKGIMHSTSSDGGQNWSEPSLSNIQHPVARFHIRRLASGRLLLVKHGKTIDTHQGRSMLTAWLSDDDGQTWRGGLILDERTGVSYPDGFQAPDGTLYISYDRNRAQDGEILLAKFTEEDILAQKLVDQKSKLKLLISRPLAPRWFKVTNHAGWEPRDSQGEVVFDDKLWIFGGWLNSYAAPPRDVWSSADGKAWTQVLAQAPWKHSDLSMSIVFADKMWFMGGWYNGRLEGHSASNEVWSSTDGANWEQVSAQAGWTPRIAAAIVKFKGQMWLLGGTENYYFGDDTSLKNDVWCSEDGRAWKLVTDSAQWSPRAYHQAVVLNDKIYVFGGGNYVPNYHALNDVWSSADGVHWQQETAAAPWPARLWFSSVVYRDQMWLLGGWSNNPSTNWGDVWHSPDGKTWSQLKTNTSWKARHEHSAFVFHDKIWIAGGHAQPLSSEVWSLELPSTDDPKTEYPFPSHN